MAHLLKKLSEGETFWMFTIAGLGMLTLGIGFLVVAWWGIPEAAGELLGVMVALIGAQINSVINSIRARWRVDTEGEV